VTETQPAPPSGAIRIFVVLLGVIGLVLIIGGAYLLTLGGSPYYLLAGLATTASGILVSRRDWRGAWLYGAMLVATLAWSMWEAGLDSWALVPRLVAPTVLGLGFLLPPIRRGLVAPEVAPMLWHGWRGLGIGVAGAFVFGLLLHFVTGGNPADPVYQTGTIAPSQLAAAQPLPADPAAGDWLHYGNDQGGTRFSSLDQITPANVAKLKPIWTVHVGGIVGNPMEKLEATPLKIGDSLYICTGYNDVMSIDAETGHINWRFRAGVNQKQVATGVCRGVAYYQVPGAIGLCAQRIYTATGDARLIAMDSATGAPCPGFGNRGQVSLLTGMGKADPAYYGISSAPQVVRGKIVLGGFVLDGQYWGEPSGAIRAFDAVTGQFAWAFDMGRPDQHREPGPGQTYTLATPNSWPPISADEALGLVYLPIGNATPDYYGARRRPFDDQFSSSVIALDAETGALRWSFQTVHHDIWDYDVASQPTLIDIRTPQGIRQALIQPTKRGEIFVLDRRTGRPLTTIEERPAPQGGIAPGERMSPTQPFSVGMPSVRGPDLRERDMWGLTPLDQLYCRILFRRARYDGPLTPPGLGPAIVYPGYVGGVDWGGVAIDRARQIMIVNSNRVANYDTLIPRAIADKMGIKPYQSGAHQTNIAGAGAQEGTPFAADVRPFFSFLYVPCNEPPYGMIAGVDLVSRKVIWSHPFGTARYSGPLGIPSLLPFTMGVPNQGGAVVTKSGLAFIGASQDSGFRAFDVTTGKEVWQARLPGGGNATPMTYLSPKSNRQFVVIAAGGFVYLGSRQSDAIVAYALPK
jgi:quinoprotein glucose dehydrogenase